MPMLARVPHVALLKSAENPLVNSGKWPTISSARNHVPDAARPLAE
ncbi:hypothetical protein [Nocardia australiensis]|nr:hypothetical protein [Nocardia australiensis]